MVLRVGIGYKISPANYRQVHTKAHSFILNCLQLNVLQQISVGHTHEAQRCSVFITGSLRIFYPIFPVKTSKFKNMLVQRTPKMELYLHIAKL